MNNFLTDLVAKARDFVPLVAAPVQSVANFIGQIPDAFQRMDNISKFQRGIGPAVDRVGNVVQTQAASNDGWTKGPETKAEYDPQMTIRNIGYDPYANVQQPNTQQPSTQGGFNIPGVPSNLSQIFGQVFENQGQRMDATTAAQILKHPQGQQILGQGRGENPDFKTILDIPNRINPKTGRWDDNAPIKQVFNPFTGKNEDSIDRGLWRINNETFYNYLKNFPDLLKQYGITSYEDMNDPTKNTIMAKLILQYQGADAWFAAPQNLSGFGKLQR